jgi:hypothetical protein
VDFQTAIDWSLLVLAAVTAGGTLSFEFAIYRRVKYMAPMFEKLDPVVQLFQPVLHELKNVDPATARALAANIRETIESARTYRDLRAKIGLK